MSTPPDNSPGNDLPDITGNEKPRLTRRQLRTQGEMPSSVQPNIFNNEQFSTVGSQVKQFKDSPNQRQENHHNLGSKRRRPFLVISFLLVLVLVGAFFGFKAMAPFLSKSTSGDDYIGTGSGEVSVEIPTGATGSQMAENLLAAEVIKSKQKFIEECLNDSRSNSIQPGTYTLQKHMSSRAALLALIDGSTRANNDIIIPPGFTIWQLHDRLAKFYKVDVQTVENALNKVSLPSQANGQIEGWIAPGSYAFDANIPVEGVVQKMVDKQVENLKSAGVPENLWQRTLTVASIVLKECQNEEEWGKVARVIENRLQDNSQTHGLLQMDSTALYAAHKTTGIPTAEDLKLNSPYNTYVSKGLPPTAIGAPTEEAMRAVLNSPAGNWLYFVTVDLDTGETIFTNDYQVHLQNVEKIKEWRSKH